MVNVWDDPESAERLRSKLTIAIASLQRLLVNHSEAARIQWQGAARKYRERWAQGDLDGIAPVLSDLLTWVRQSNIDLSRNTDVVALFTDPAFDRLRSRIPAINGDPKIRDLCRRLTSVGAGTD
ncbi:MAG TPA: hypothetical protein VH496_21815 [Mycobacterium sp.]|jgi:RNA polymerase-interacting CarD/CdnL/TRCF family regulator